MKKQCKHNEIILFITIICFLIFICFTNKFMTMSVNAAEELVVHVIDVGQGLSVLLESEGEYVLYDGGPADYSSKIVSYLKQHNVSSLKYLIASHYDDDHINGLVGALNVFSVENVICPNYVADTRVFYSFINLMEEKLIEKKFPYKGDIYSFGDAQLMILSPENREYGNDNDYSIVIRVRCGQTTILLTGDASVVNENEMISAGEELTSNILVCGHHGSADSTSEAFLDVVNPVAAVISCQSNNKYLHPSQEVMDRLWARGIEVFRTDLQGDLVFTSDGNAWYSSVDACNDYSGGLWEENASETYFSLVPDNENEKVLDITKSFVEDNYVLNNHTMKFHYEWCDSVSKMDVRNRENTSLNRDDLIANGYSPCGSCKP